MSKKESLVEDTFIQIKNLENAINENAKGILASTMKEEIKSLVKESLKEQEDEEIEDVEVAKNFLSKSTGERNATEELFQTEQARHTNAIKWLQHVWCEIMLVKTFQ